MLFVLQSILGKWKCSDANSIQLSRVLILDNVWRQEENVEMTQPSIENVYGGQ